jgi:hypothetical protein
MSRNSSSWKSRGSLSELTGNGVSPHQSSFGDILLVTHVPSSKINVEAGHQWLTSIILATWKAEIGRIVVPRLALANSSESPK